MSEPIGQIPIEIVGDFSQLQGDLQQAEAIAEKGGKEISEALNAGFATTGSLEEFYKSLDTGLKEAAVEAQKGGEDVAAAFTKGITSYADFGTNDVAGAFTKGITEAGEAASHAAIEAAQEADTAFKEFGESVSQAIEHPIQAFRALVESMGPVAVATVAIGAGIAELAHKVSELVLEEGAAAEATQNMAYRLNLSFEETKKLGEMAQIAGISIDVLGRVSMRLADALENQSGSGKKVADALKSIGVVANDSGQALLQMLEKLSEIPDATERIAKAHEIMGRGAVQLEPLLRNYKELAAAVESLGGQLSEDMVKRLLEADDAADKLAISWAHLKEGLAATFAPAVKASIDALVSLLNGTQPLTLDKQIAQLDQEIKNLTNDADAATIALAKATQRNAGSAAAAMGGAGTSGLSTLGVDNAALIEQKKLLKENLEIKQQSIEYNKELDASNAAAAAAQKKAAADAIEAAKQFAKDLADAKSTLGFDDIPAQIQKIEDAYKFLAKSGTLSVEQLDTAHDAMLAKLSQLADKLPGVTLAYKEFGKAQAAAVAALPQLVADLQVGEGSFSDSAKKIKEVQAALNSLKDGWHVDSAPITIPFKQVADAATVFNDIMKKNADFLKHGDPLAVEAFRENARELTGYWGQIDQAGISLSSTFQELKGSFIGTIQILKNEGITAYTTLANNVSRAAESYEQIAENVQNGTAAIQDQIKAHIVWEQSVIALGNSYGALNLLQQQDLALAIQIKTLRGESATKEIAQLETLRLRMESLQIATRAWGDVIVGISHAFTNIFDNFDKGLVKVITSGAKIQDVFKDVAKQFEEDVVGAVVHGLTESLKKLFIDKILAPIFDQIFGSIGKLATQAPQVAATTANTAALTANTAALTALSGALSAASGASAASSAAGAGGGLASDAGGLTSVVGAVAGVVSAISSIVGNFQMSHMNKLLGEIEVTTRGQLNEALNLRKDLWQQQDNLFHKLDDMWNAIRDVTTAIVHLGDNLGDGGGGNGGGGGGLSTDDLIMVLNGVMEKYFTATSPAEGGGGSGFTLPGYNTFISSTLSLGTVSSSFVDSTTQMATAASDAAGKLQGAVAPFVGGIQDMTTAIQAATATVSPSGATVEGMVLGSQLAPHYSFESAPSSGMSVGMLPGSALGSQLVTSGTLATVTVNALDPSGRATANAIVNGLEEKGIRVR